MEKDKLKEYRQKRKFEITTEPKGEVIKKKEKELVFVVHEHWATHHHFDFRLEKEGVLESWAIPKEIPLEPNVKRLAVKVEPHPLEYSSFQGKIPEGQYGAGVVKIWDRGTYSLIEKTEKRIVFNLQGKKLKGQYTLLFFKPPKNWLLFKNK